MTRQQKLDRYLDVAEKSARLVYGCGLTALDRVRLAEAFDADVPVEQAVNELFAPPPED